MKSLYTLAVIGVFAVSGYTSTAHAANALSQSEIATQIGGHTICATADGDSWQEYHTGNTTQGGDLWDYKRGANHPTDPTKKVGTWSVSGNGNNTTLNHHYGSNTYSWVVYSEGGQIYKLVGPKNIIATVLPNQVACPN